MSKYTITAISLILLSSTVGAYAKDCSAQFYDGKAPVVTNSPVAQRTTNLCFEEYAVLYSGETRTPLWSAEFLTNNRIKEARKLKRNDSFHEEDQIPASDRSTLADYKGSSYYSHSLDRGHMSPNSDFSTYSAQFESFSLANIIPQDSNNNQHLWESIESATRKLVTQRERLYVITGPIFDNTNEKLHGRVTIPTRIFKAIVDPSRKEAAAYITNNQSGSEYSTVSIAELERTVGINLFPDLPSTVKNTKMNLPVPVEREGGFRNGSHASYRHSNSVSSNTTDVPHLLKSLRYALK